MTRKAKATAATVALTLIAIAITLVLVLHRPVKYGYCQQQYVPLVNGVGCPPGTGEKPSP